MPTPRNTTAYRARLTELRAAVVTRLQRDYAGDMDASDIPGSFSAFARRAVPRIQAGQATAQVLAAAYVRSQTGTLAPLLNRAGQTQHGESLEEGMAAIPSMVLGQIGNGRAAAEALEYGNYLAGRFADSEVTATADAEVAHQAQAARIIGWNGIVSGSACANCASRNSGFHDWETPIYRHGACHCTLELAFG